jgi:glycosyltransferase involved in cell wall biosynthesis
MNGMMPKKTSSLIMANYNHGHFLTDSLTSIFSQTRPVDEVLVIDDASTDNSLEILQSFQRKEARLKVLRNNKNQGAVFSINRGLHEAAGDVVCFHSADDFIVPTFFHFSVGMLERCHMAGLCCSYFSMFHDSTKLANPGKLPWSDTPTYLSPEDLIRLKVRGNIPGHSSVYLKQCIIDAGTFIPELKWHCDWFLIQVIAARTGICFIPAALAFLRINDSGSYSSGRANWPEQKEVVRHMIKLLLSTPYRDVVPFFQRCSCLSHIFADVARLLLEEPEFLNTDEMLTIFAMLAEHEQEALVSSLASMKEQYPTLVPLCEARRDGTALSR